MNYRYPPDADAEDVFPREKDEIDRVLTEAEAVGYEAALDLACDLMSDRLPNKRVDEFILRAEDLLEWFGRRPWTS